MKKEKWHKLHTWRVNIPYYDHEGHLAMDKITLSLDEAIDRETATKAIRRWGLNKGIVLSSDEVATILQAGTHGFA